MAKRELSEHAHAAKLCRNICKKLGVKASVRSSVAAMCDAVDIQVTDLHPDLIDTLTHKTQKHQMGKFDSMTDMYEYTNRDATIPQVKYLNIQNKFSEELKAKVWSWLVNGEKFTDTKGLTDVWEDAKKQNILILNEHADMIVWRLLQNKEYWGLSFWDENEQQEKEQSNSSKIEVEKNGARISEHTHTKKQTQIFIVEFDQSFSREDFNDLRTSAKNSGGWYSRKWGSTPNGFAFPTHEQANEWMQVVFNQETTTENKTPNNKPALKVVNNAISGKLRKMAENLTKAVDDKLADRLTNTAKRMAQYNHSRVEGLKLQRTQSLMLKIADHIEAGTLPEALNGITKKQDLIDLMSSELEPVNNGYHQYYTCTGKPLNDDPATKAAWELVGDSGQEDSQELEIRKAMQSIQFVNIDGYYPTPDKVVDQIINDYACIDQDHSVLEPSAGSGNFLEGLKRIDHKGDLDICEYNHSLRQVLKAKGYEPKCHDFLELDPKQKQYDRVLMNPPFEKQQDIIHIKHALKFLNDGGVLAAVCSESVMFRSNKLTEEFRELLEEYTHEFVSLEAGEFKESGTNVKTQILIINK